MLAINEIKQFLCNMGTAQNEKKKLNMFIHFIVYISLKLKKK